MISSCHRKYLEVMISIMFMTVTNVIKIDKVET